MYEADAAVTLPVNSINERDAAAQRRRRAAEVDVGCVFQAYFPKLTEERSTNTSVLTLPGAIEYLPQSVSASMFVESLHLV